MGSREGVSEKRKEGDGEAMEVGSGEAAGKETAQDEASGGQNQYKYSMELLGIVNTTYQFSGNAHMSAQCQYQASVHPMISHLARKAALGYIGEPWFLIILG